MAHGYYLNLEMVLIEIVASEISMMGTSNTLNNPDNDNALNDEAFAQNLKHGIMALCAMCDYLECCINSVVRVTYRITFQSMKTPHEQVWEYSESEIKGIFPTVNQMGPNSASVSCGKWRRP